MTAKKPKMTALFPNLSYIYTASLNVFGFISQIRFFCLAEQNIRTVSDLGPCVAQFRIESVSTIMLKMTIKKSNSHMSKKQIWATC